MAQAHCMLMPDKRYERRVASWKLLETCSLGASLPVGRLFFSASTRRAFISLCLSFGGEPSTPDLRTSRSTNEPYSMHSESRALHPAARSGGHCANFATGTRSLRWTIACIPQGSRHALRKGDELDSARSPKVVTDVPPPTCLCRRRERVKVLLWRVSSFKLLGMCTVCRGNRSPRVVAHAYAGPQVQAKMPEKAQESCRTQHCTVLECTRSRESDTPCKNREKEDLLSAIVMMTAGGRTSHSQVLQAKKRRSLKELRTFAGNQSQAPLWLLFVSPNRLSPVLS
jgi:hypothetical protein